MTEPFEPFLAAAVQMESGEDKAANLAAATRLIEQAAADGARLVALPELFNCFGRFETVVAQAEPIPGPTSDALGQIAARLHVVLSAGSIAERDEATGRTFNTSLLFDPQGRLLVRYRKIHRFDVELPGQVSVRESKWISAGENVAAAATSLGTVGVAICYDLRFPELFRRLASAGAEIIVIPSAFTHATGRDHWEVLLRARAIENQAYIVAPNQAGHRPPQPASHGHSAMIDPWGRVLAMADDAQHETIVTAVIDLQRLAEIREQLPALAHRRIF